MMSLAVSELCLPPFHNSAEPIMVIAAKGTNGEKMHSRNNPKTGGFLDLTASIQPLGVVVIYAATLVHT